MHFCMGDMAGYSSHVEMAPKISGLVMGILNTAIGAFPNML